MKRKPYSLSVFALMLAVIILSGLLMLPGCSSSQPDNTNPSDGSTPPESTSATEPSGEATVPSTEATEPEFFVPTEYPDITTYGYTLQPPHAPLPRGGCSGGRMDGVLLRCAVQEQFLVLHRVEQFL